MRFKREQVAVALSALAMVVGLTVAAVAVGWVTRLGGAAMVAGGSVALALTDVRVRRTAWVVAALGGLAAIAGCH